MVFVDVLIEEEALLPREREQEEFGARWKPAFMFGALFGVGTLVALLVLPGLFAGAVLALLAVLVVATSTFCGCCFCCGQCWPTTVMREVWRLERNHVGCAWTVDV